VDYLDFEVEVSPLASGEYSVRVLRSPAGEASETMRFPFDTLALQNRLQALQIALLRSSGTRRRIDAPEARTVQQFGTELWQALFAGDVLTRFEVSRNEARTQNVGLRLKLRFSAPELAALPWEYLYDSGRGDYLSLSLATPLVRYISLSESIEPLTVQPPLRILGLIVSPDDLAPLDVQREKQRLEYALARLRDRGLVELEWLEGRTWRDLRQALREGPWHIFHFIGHGGFDELHGEGVIALADDEGRSRRLSATDLGRFLGDHDPLRLAVLNSCESARGDQADVFSSTAAVLVRRGTPAVVAMQYEITDTAAIEFSRSFYEAIADGLPVDTAVAEARKGIAVAISDTLEWGTPVLFMRAPDGVLFRTPETAKALFEGDGAERPGDPTDGGLATAPVAPADRPETPTREGAETMPPASVLGIAQAPPRAIAAVEAAPPRRPRSRRIQLLGLGMAAVVVVASLGLFANLLMRPSGPAFDMTLSTDRARPGEAVTIRGSGFLAGETVDIVIAGVVRARPTAGPDGSFQIELTIPGDAGEFSSIDALGLASGGRVSRPFDVQVQTLAPSIANPIATPSEGPPRSATVTASPSAEIATNCKIVPIPFDPTSVDLNGAWAGDDLGIYYIRQLDSIVWWNGMSGRAGPPLELGRYWNNVGRGEMNGLDIEVEWADLPRGQTIGNGTLSLRIEGDATGNLRIVKVGESGWGYSNNIWTPCSPG
jgi:hypothetical protein